MKILLLRVLIGVVAVAVLGAAAALVVEAGDRPTAVEAAQPSLGQAPVPPATAPTTTDTTATPTTTPSGPITTSTTSTSVPRSADQPARARLGPGDTGPSVAALQSQLRQLGYWLGKADGDYGFLTVQAVTAFQKVEGLTPDGIAGQATLAALAEAERPEARSTDGDRIEIDKARQVLFVVRGGVVASVLNVSTGTEQPYHVNGRIELADTPPGRWTVSWVVDGVDVGELGALYRPRYFHPDGIAVHGYHSVPPYPASHGCVRVSEAAMDWIWANGLMPVGAEVWVY